VSWEQEIPEAYPVTPIDKVTVFDIEATDTGLVDQDGAPIMKSIDKVGFIR
jgi:hypothetical protein